MKHIDTRNNIYYFNEKLITREGFEILIKTCDLEIFSRFLEFNERIPSQIDYRGFAYWSKEGKLHRATGPAIIQPDDDEFEARYAWCLMGKSCPFQNWLEETPGLSNDEKLLFKLNMGNNEFFDTYNRNDIPEE